MSLLTDFLKSSLEPSYAAAAQRRASGATSRFGSTAVVVTAVIMGLTFATAFTNMQSLSSVVNDTRAQLLGQIESRQQQGDRDAELVQDLQQQIAVARAAALGPGQEALLEEVARLETAAGLVPMTGPGLVVSLDDAPREDNDGASGERDTEAFSNNRVNAADLQLVVNALWEAGAEAIAVNDQRLTMRSAISFAGEAILVDFRPLTRPYVVTALGDPRGMIRHIGNAPVAGYLKALEQNYGIRSSLETSEALQCPAGALGQPRFARSWRDGIPSQVSPAPAPRATTR